MKRKLSILLCTCIVLGPISMDLIPTYAHSQPAKDIETISDIGSANPSSLTEPDISTLTDITSHVKSKITIPKAFSEFEYHYNSGSSISIPKWNLTWSNKDSTERITVVCDSNKHIISFRHSVDDKSDQNEPIFLKKELKTKSDEFIKKTNPDIFSNLEYTSTGNASIYSGTYAYCYRRVENGIPMPDNTVEVNINYKTGKVVSLYTEWLYDVTIPTGETKLTKEESAKKIGSNLTMELDYELLYSNEGIDFSKQAYLVYHPDKSYLSIDAKTGKVYLLRNEWQSTGDTSSRDQNASEESSLSGSSKKGGGELTREEIASISKLEKLISQKTAIQAVKNEKSLLLDESCTTINANLRLSYSRYDEQDGKYVWDISFSNSNKPVSVSEDSYVPFARASIDAKNGKILSYHASTPEYYNSDKEKWDTVSVKYNLKECQPIFEAFAKKQNAEYFNNAKLTNSSNDYIATYKNDKPVYGGYNYTFSRMNESVPFLYNGFSGSVDGVTGKIYQFNINWDEKITFQSTKDTISPSQAFDHYISKDGYGLFYEINTIHNTKEGSQKDEVRLVYRADITPSTISPFSGEQLDYNGKTSTGKNNSYTYVDIDSSENKRVILLLADLGIGFDGGKFEPTNKMTKGELETMLSSLKYSSMKLSNKESIENITRIDAIKRIITYTSLDKVAKFENIYKTDFKDQEKIASSDLGYVALAKGMGIVSGDTFRGTDILTREDAAQMIFNLLSSDY